MSRSVVVVVAALVLLLLLVVAGRPKVAMGIAFVAILSSRSLLFATGVDALGYLDETCVVVLFVWQIAVPYARGRRLRSFPGLLWFAGFAALGLVSAVVAGVPLVWALESAFLTLKGVLFGWSVAQVDWQKRDILKIARLGTGIVIVILVAGAINLLVPGPWTRVLANDHKPDYRGFVPSVIGPFVHPGEFGVATALASVAVAAWIATHKATGRNVLLLAGTLVGCLLSFRRKSTVGVLAALTWLGFTTNRVRTAVIVALAAPIVLMSLWSTLTNVVTSTRAEYFDHPGSNARVVLTLGAIDVANVHFPLGAGFARYGSDMASVHYSPEYTQRHFARVWGLGTTPTNGFALTDTMWPEVLGETGYVGAIAFMGGLVAIYRSGRSLRRDDDPEVRWLALVVGGWSIALVLESVAAATYSTPPEFPLLFGVAAVLHAVNSRRATPLGAVRSTSLSSPGIRGDVVELGKDESR